MSVVYVPMVKHTIQERNNNKVVDVGNDRPASVWNTNSEQMIPHTCAFHFASVMWTNDIYYLVTANPRIKLRHVSRSVNQLSFVRYGYFWPEENTPNIAMGYLMLSYH
jgi:hypothetical protein